MIDKLKMERYDYFLIWGHGLKYKEEIIEVIRKTPYLKILAIIKHNPKNIVKLVKAIYSYDYAPFKHLRNKTKYLLSTEPIVFFIFVVNKHPKEVYIGKCVFKHIESLSIKSLKEKIRDKFNERENNRRSENHIIHASDNQSQTDYILKYLGYKNGVERFMNIPNPILSIPYHIGKFNKFTLKCVNISAIRCSIVMSLEINELFKLEETPHFSFLSGNTKPYEEYLLKFGGIRLKDDYSFNKFSKLYKNFKYLREPYSTNYILLKGIQDGLYQVIDGVHRVIILKYRGINSFIGAVKE